MDAQDRFNRIQQLKRLGAPRWIIKNEQLQLAAARQNITDEQHETLLDKHVRPLMDGVGYITVPDCGE